MQPIFSARRSVALGIAIAVIVVSLGSVLLWRAAIGRQGALGAAPGPGASGHAGELADPAQVHEQWVVALRDGDRPQALWLYAPGDLHDAAVDNQLQRMDSKLHSPSSTLGQLVRVTPEAPKVDGAQARGHSLVAHGGVPATGKEHSRDDLPSRAADGYTITDGAASHEERRWHTLPV
jgi:hypothetical protein